MRSRIYPEYTDQSTSPNLHAHVMSNENKFPLNKAWLEAFRARIFENSRVVKKARERVQTTHRMLVSSYKVRRCVSHRHTTLTVLTLLLSGHPRLLARFRVHLLLSCTCRTKVTTRRKRHTKMFTEPAHGSHSNANTHYLCYITPQDAIYPGAVQCSAPTRSSLV